MIPIEQVEQMIAAGVAQVTSQLQREIDRLTAELAVALRTMTERVVPLQEALAQAKQVIAKLQTQLYGTRAETSQVVLTAEGQQLIDANWGVSQETTPAPPAQEKREQVVRRPRDRRGLAQRYPHLRLEEIDAPLPPEWAEQVAKGTLIVRRSGRHQDQLVAPAGRPFLRRVHELELVRTATNQVVVQTTPDCIVPGGDFADETIHRFVTEKTLDALPFHRQVARLGRDGVDISKQTVNDAVNAWGDLFAPLSLAILAQVLASPVVHADASWQRVQAPGTCDRINLWTTLGGGQVAYRITEDLCHKRASELIPDGFAGRLMVDAWPGWFSLALLERLGLCNAHARRPFADWLKRHPNTPQALQFIALYRDLYRCEHDADSGPPEGLLDRRRRIRDERSRPIMAQILLLARATLAAYGKAHQLGDGALYIIDHWDGLSRFLDDPLMPIDNNAAENALRVNALIRKNSMFCGSLDAAHRDAVAMTVLQSCRLAKFVPADYLATVTPRLLLHRRGRKQDLAAITPGAMAAVRQATKVG
jgi:transposase